MMQVGTGRAGFLQKPTSLTNRTSLGIVPNPTGAVQFIDCAATNVWKFYRGSQP